MHRMMAIAAGIALVAGGASGASAHAFNGAARIMQGDYRGAEREIATQRGQDPDDADLMLNLATVYARTGRPMAARALLLAMVARPNEEVVLSDRSSAWSHALAGDALSRLPVQLSAR